MANHKMQHALEYDFQGVKFSWVFLKTERSVKETGTKASLKLLFSNLQTSFS